MHNFVQSALTSRLRFARASRLRRILLKTSMVIACGVAIGVFDAWQVAYLPIGNYGELAAIEYQVAIIITAAVAAVASLYDERWNLRRNALSLLMAIPIAAISDNVSLDLQVMKPYVLILPQSGFMWRLQVFGNTAFYPLASWVDAQTFAPGLIDGYVAALAFAAAYVLIQITWDRLELETLNRLVHASRSLIAGHFPIRRGRI
jgi:hypothetical protein